MEPALSDTTHTPSSAVSRAEWTRLGVAGTLALASEVLHLTSSPEIWVMGSAAAAMLLSGRDMLEKGWRAVRALKLGINFLMTLAVTGAIILGEWPEAAMVTVLFAIAEKVEDYAVGTTRGAIRNLIRLSPDVALARSANGEWAEVRSASVDVGQMIRIKPGARVPLDGIVRSGTSEIDQSPITGESVPVGKALGDEVFAGTLNQSGSLDVEVTHGRRDTTLARIIETVRQAQSHGGRTQRMVDRFARYYTPAIVLAAIAIAVLPPLLAGAAWTEWFYRALVLLVIACPCALVISTPVTIVSALTAAARSGILVKGGVFMENGHRLKALAFDKTGTLTTGQLTVTDVEALTESISPETALETAALLEMRSEHSVARAIVNHWKSGLGGDGVSAAPEIGGPTLAAGAPAPAAATGPAAGAPAPTRPHPPAPEPDPVTDFSAIPGKGVRGLINGHRYFVGNHRFAHESGVCDAALETRLAGLEQQGKTAVVLFDKERALAVFAVSDTVRPEAREVMETLRDLGIRPVMLTGDNAATARFIADQSGIDQALSDLLPEDKLTAIDRLRANHDMVGMVGDGINDAPALAQADIGFAMGSGGTDMAIATADVALLTDNLRGISRFLKLSRKASRLLAWNIGLALVIKFVFFGLAVAGMATLWMAVFADMGASLIVTFNGLRMLRA